jgi:hypothetical protein
MPTFIPTPGETHELDLRDLTDHPLLGSVPVWSREDARFQALVESIREHGLDYELLVDTEFRIVDGRNRRNALSVLGARARVRFVEKADAASIVVASLINRRHLTKGALAYIAAPMLDEVISESKARRLTNLRRSGQARGPQSLETPLSGVSGKTASELATQMGIGHTLFEQAIQLRKMFMKAGKEAREKYEGRVIDDWQDETGEWHPPVGLGYMINGLNDLIEGNAAKQLGKRNEHDRLFIGSLSKLSLHWDQANPEQRRGITEGLKRTLLAFPAELVAEIAEIAKKTASEQRRIEGVR